MEPISDQIEQAYDDPGSSPDALRDALDAADNQGVPPAESDELARICDGLPPFEPDVTEECRLAAVVFDDEETLKRLPTCPACHYRKYGSCHLDEAMGLMKEVREYSDRFGGDAEELVRSLMGQIAVHLAQASRAFAMATRMRRMGH